jgi:hypothetical protein
VCGTRQIFPQGRSGGSSRVRTPTLGRQPSVFLEAHLLDTVSTHAIGMSHRAQSVPDHLGVIKAFIDAEFMPRVHSGTSAGGVLAALVCTRTDSELRGLLSPALAQRITAFEEPFSTWGRRVWKTGARFDGVHWARKVGAVSWTKFLCLSMLSAPGSRVDQ